MQRPQDDHHHAADASAERLARHLKDTSVSFAEAAPEIDAAYHELLEAVSQIGSSYAFDRAGRPGAIEAVRQALPAAERDLFDAILDDCACELAATQEALFRVALAYGRRRARGE
jgi:hypothetical protein